MISSKGHWQAISVARPLHNKILILHLRRRNKNEESKHKEITGAVHGASSRLRKSWQEYPTESRSIDFIKSHKCKENLKLDKIEEVMEYIEKALSTWHAVGYCARS